MNQTIPDELTFPLEILPFPFFLDIFHGNHIYQATFDDYFISSDGTISIFVEFVEEPYPNIKPRSLIFRESYYYYYDILHFITQPDPEFNYLPGCHHYINE